MAAIVDMSVQGERELVRMTAVVWKEESGWPSRVLLGEAFVAQQR